MGIQMIIDRWLEKSSIENQGVWHACIPHFGGIWKKQEGKFKRRSIGEKTLSSFILLYLEEIASLAIPF